MKTSKDLIYFILFFFVSFSCVSAKQYEVNTQHSFVNFELSYMKVSKVKGAFDDFKASFDLDEDTGKVSGLSFSIKAKSIKTRDIKRDNHLKGKSFFNIKKYPFITFTGEGYKYENYKLREVSGELELLGIKKQVSFEIDWKGIQKDPLSKGKKSLFLEARASIDRKAFGLSWNRTFDGGGWIVGNEVIVEAVIEANPIDGRLAFSRFYTPDKKDAGGSLKERAVEKMPEVAVLKNKKKSLKVKQTPVVKSIEREEVQLGKGLESPQSIKGHGEFSLYLILIIIGLALFVVGSIFFKKYMLDFFERFMSERTSEIVSDTFLYVSIFVLAVYSAKYMGYGTF